MADLRIRVLTYNVRSLRDDRQAVVRLLRMLEPDVVCIQEAPRRFRWRYYCARLAADSGLLYVAGGGSTSGTLLLSRLEVGTDRVLERMLSKTPGMYDRGLAAAVLRAGRRHFVVGSVHLGLSAPERQRHVVEVRSVLAGLGPDESPLIVAGDLNEPPGAPAWLELAKRLQDTLPEGGPTFPAVNPRHRIDAIFASDHFEVERSEVVEHPDVLTASDHRPVLADLVLGG